MIVECPECGTRFSLDESRITGATAKVRCSNCRQVFRINRAGQVVEPPVGISAETPPRREIREEAPVPPAFEAVESSPALAEVTGEASEGEPGQGPAPRPKKGRLRWWLLVLMLVVLFLGALGWWVWQWQQPESAVPDSQAGPTSAVPQ